MKVGLSLLYLEVAGLGLKEWLSQGPSPGLYEVVDNGPLSPTQEQVERLRRLEGFSYTVHGPYDGINIASLNQGLRRNSLEAHKRSMEMACKLGAEVYVLHPGRALNGDAELNRQAIYELLEYGEKLGLRVGLENGYMGSKPLTYLPKHFRELEGVPIILDVGHAFVAGVLDEFLGLKERILEVHFHDNDGTGDDHLCLGDGVIPWARVARELREAVPFGVVESVEKPFLALERLREALK